MATNASRRAREKRMRARYRRKIWLTGIIMLLIGLAAGYLVCMMTTEPQVQVVEGPAPTPEIIYITPEPTEVPTPTPVPTAVVTAEPIVIEIQVTPEPVVVTPEPVVVTPEPVVVTPEPVVAVEATQAPIAIEPAAEEPTNILAPLTMTEATQAPIVAEPVATATPAAPAAAAKPAPVIVPYGESVTFDTQITAEGKARLVADASPYETVSLTVGIDAHRGPSYFQSNYADSYLLKGNEAVVEFELTLNNYTGNTDIIPQNFLLVTFRGDSDAVKAQGFQLMDAEIGGKSNIGVYSDTPTTLYKRYPYDSAQGDMVYMVVNTYNNGVENTFWFEVNDPNPAPMYGEDFEELTTGSKGEEVAKLQQKLIDMGLLGGSADGKFGKKTGEAVTECQNLLGLEETGIADAALMNALFDIF